MHACFVDAGDDVYLVQSKAPMLPQGTLLQGTTGMSFLRGWSPCAVEVTFVFVFLGLRPLHEKTPRCTIGLGDTATTVATAVVPTSHNAVISCNAHGPKTT